MVFLENGAIAATGATASFLAEGAPEAFRRYVGANITKFARKQT